MPGIMLAINFPPLDKIFYTFGQAVLRALSQILRSRLDDVPISQISKDQRTYLYSINLVKRESNLWQDCDIRFLGVHAMI